MKKSVWDHKFWRRKMGELPIHDDLDTAWQQMNQLLDRHFDPVSSKPAPLPKKTLVQHFVQAIQLVFPLIMVAGVVYFAFYQKNEVVNPKKVIKQKPYKVGQEIQRSENLRIADRTDPKILTNKIESRRMEEKEIFAINKLIEPVETETSRQKNVSKIAWSTPALEKIMRPSLSDTYGEHSASLSSYSSNTIEVRTTSSVVLPRELNQVRPLTIGDERQAKSQLSARSKREQRRIKRALSRDSLAKAKELQEQQRASLKPIKVKPKKNTPKAIVSPQLSYELQAGIRLGKQNTSPYLGIQTQWAFPNRWLLGAGLRLNQLKLKGEYFHPGYNTVTTASPFQVVDSRKLTNMALPLHISYRLNKWMSLKTEANLAVVMGQSGGSKVGHVVNYLDTVFHTKPIEQALLETNVNKLHFNMGGGASIQFKRLNIEAMYFYQVTPYRVSSSLGAYQQRYNSFSIGLGYRF